MMSLVASLVACLVACLVGRSVEIAWSVGSRDRLAHFPAELHSLLLVKRTDMRVSFGCFLDDRRLVLPFHDEGIAFFFNCFDVYYQIQ